MNTAASYSEHVILRDGGSIRIRAIRPDDKQRLVEHFRSLSSRSVYFRFFSSKRQLSEDDLLRFTEIDFVRHVGLVATLIERGEERIIGVGRYIVAGGQSDPPRRAEVAFAVTDGHQGRGIGTVLLEHLAGIARERGIVEFEADVLGENNRMLQVFAKSGFVVRRSIESGVVHVSFPTEETDEFREASHHRERAATAQSLRALLEPRTVAMVGASRKPGSVGSALLRNLRAAGFRGPIHAIHPSATELEGLAVHRSIAEIGTPVDLAVVAVPAEATEAVIEDCARAGVRGVVVISSGFAEAGDEGRTREIRIRDRVRASGMRMIGPNCLGILNTDPEISLNATFARTFPPRGGVGMSSQSGALGIAILDAAAALNLGITTFVSVGNKADVSTNDLLAYWKEDSATRVILLYLESFGNPRKFGRVAPEVADVKPIVAVKSGRSASGMRAASSHSAALASLDVAVDALFEQAGVIRTTTLEEMFDVAALFATQPVPAGRRIGVVTNAGGPGILLADACEARGLELPALAEETVAELRSFLPPQAGYSNPIDLLASAGGDAFARAIAAVGRDPNVDALVAIYVPVMVTETDEIAAAIARGAGDLPPEKPILTVFLSARGAPPMLGSGPRGAIPSYSYPENAALALASAERYGRWRRRERGTPQVFDRTAASAIRAVVDRVVAGKEGPFWMEPADLATILRAAGIDFAEVEIVSARDATTAAERMGYPLVAKAVSPDVLHKSDVGGVVVGLENRDDVARAVDLLEERMAGRGFRLEGILLQREVKGGIEALVGVTTDPTFGPLLVCGLGGVLVEILRDVAFHLSPVTDVDARTMISRLKAARLLDGYRGSPPADRDALARVLLRISALVELVPEIRELDLNPVKVLEPGRGAIAVDGRLRLSAGAGT
jgi:acetate---CoA ligase (ADP-forming)